MARRYKCLYCDNHYERAKLITHIERVHKELIPEGYDGARLVFDMINHTTGGRCRVCGSPTKWNGSRYDVLCDNPKCKEKMREEYKKNMLRVRGTYNILNDPEQQKIMLQHRRISGKYQHSDGGVINYCGEYEKQALEFMDLMLQIPSKEIFTSAPIIEYTYQGKKHIYIPDFYLPLYNLIIEIKDGGSNKNGQQSDSRIASREKTIEKERVITDKGEYNYIRLTNNEFPQLIEMFMLMKKKLIDGDLSTTIKINENVYDDIRDYINKRIKKAPFDRVKILLHGMNKFHYDYDPSLYDDSVIKYKTMNPEEFKKYKAGLCWDYASFEANYFKANIPELKYETYVAGIESLVSGFSIHCFLIFEYRNKWFWLESAWNKFSGIRGFKTKKECLQYIAYRLSKDLESDSVFIKQYDALDEALYNLNHTQILKLFASEFKRSDRMKINPNVTYFYKYT